MRPTLILQRYVLKELVKTLTLSLVVITSILFMAMLLQIVGKMSVIDVGSFVGFLPSLVAYLVGYTLPLAILVSTTLTFGRLGADNEIIAMKACGISPVRIMLPVVMLSLYASLLCYYMSDEVIPQSHRERRKMMEVAIRALIESTITQEGSTIEQIQNFKISYFKYEDEVFHGIVIHQIDDGQAEMKWVAEKGKLVFDETAKESSLIFELFNGNMIKPDPEVPTRRKRASFEKIRLPVKLAGALKERSLRPKHQTMHRLLFVELPRQQHWYLEAENDFRNFSPNDYRTKEERESERSRREDTYRKASKKYRQVLLEIHRRRAFSTASFFWILISMGVGLLQRHRVLSFGLSATLVTAIYYPLLMLGERMVLSGYHPVMSMWMANIVTGFIGIFLIRKALRT